MSCQDNSKFLLFIVDYVTNMIYITCNCSKEKSNVRLNYQTCKPHYFLSCVSKPINN